MQRILLLSYLNKTMLIYQILIQIKNAHSILARATYTDRIFLFFFPVKLYIFLLTNSMI